MLDDLLDAAALPLLGLSLLTQRLVFLRRRVKHVIHGALEALLCAGFGFDLGGLSHGRRPGKVAGKASWIS